MHVPVLKQGDYLIASVQSVLSDADLLQLRDDLVFGITTVDNKWQAQLLGQRDVTIEILGLQFDG